MFIVCITVTVLVAILSLVMASPESGVESAIILCFGTIVALLLWLIYFIIY